MTYTSAARIMGMDPNTLRLACIREGIVPHKIQLLNDAKEAIGKGRSYKYCHENFGTTEARYKSLKKQVDAEKAAAKEEKAKKKAEKEAQKKEKAEKLKEKREELKKKKKEKEEMAAIKAEFRKSREVRKKCKECFKNGASIETAIQESGLPEDAVVEYYVQLMQQESDAEYFRGRYDMSQNAIDKAMRILGKSKVILTSLVNDLGSAYSMQVRKSLGSVKHYLKQYAGFEEAKGLLNECNGLLSMVQDVEVSLEPAMA